MKPLFLFLALLLATNSFCQGLTIPPTEGYRLNLLYNGKKWTDDYGDLKICLHLFIGTDGSQFLWVQKFDMSEKQFVALSEFVSDSIMWSSGFTRSSSDNVHWVADSFSLSFSDQPMPFRTVDINLAMDRIVAFFHRKKK